VNSGIFDKAGRPADLALEAGAKRILSLLRWLPADQRAEAVDLLLSIPSVVETPHGKIRFLNHSRASRRQVRRIMTKEPDSMKWIDAMAPGSVF